MALAGAYRRFHGKPHPRTRRYPFTVPEGFVILGEAVALEYRCSKLNGGGDGTKAVYRHEFDRGGLVCADNRMRKQLYILGSKIKVTDAGIEH